MQKSWTGELFVFSLKGEHFPGCCPKVFPEFDGHPAVNKMSAYHGLFFWRDGFPVRRNDLKQARRSAKVSERIEPHAYTSRINRFSPVLCSELSRISGTVSPLLLF